MCNSFLDNSRVGSPLQHTKSSSNLFHNMMIIIVEKILALNLWYERKSIGESLKITNTIRYKNCNIKE